MKIIAVGGTGTLGTAVVKELSKRHSVVTAGRNSGDVRVDITDAKSIEKMYQEVGKFDAVVSTTGNVHFGEFTKMTSENYFVGLNNKLMGQVNLVIVGLRYINNNGSFTLTSGMLSDDPIRNGSSAAMVNGAIDSFAIASAIEMPRGIRINAVSPTILTESVDAYGDYFIGFAPVGAARVAVAYSKSIEGAQTGQVYRVW